MTDTEDTGSHVPAGSDYVSDRTFADFPISEEVLKGLTDMGFTTATPVQAATIDPATAGRDLLVRAKTGTGKTAAFGVPIVELTPSGHRKPYALILEPTRELAQQTADQLTQIAAFKDVSCTLLVGGVAIGPQEADLRRGAEILVGTPGRVLDHIRRGNLDPSTVAVTCLDEADEMLSMGFYEDVTRILNATQEDRQVLLYSATIGNDTQRLVQRFLKDPVDVMLSTDADGVELLEHHLYETEHGVHKVRALLYVIDLEDPTSAIIFCNTREDTTTVANFLDRQGLDVQLISGDLSQARRSEVMAQVKAGAVRFLVATDVAARGIDISGLTHVINYALPQDPAVYLHRTGRTGRIGKKGVAVSLCGGSDMGTRKALENKHKIKFDVRQLPSGDDAIKMRVKRQAAQIRQAMGSLVFESYLPTVDALLERPDGKALLAASLRAFFQWDRARRQEVSSTVEGPVFESKRAQRQREGGRGRDGGGRGRRSERGERGERGDRGDRGDRRERRGRDRDRDERRDRDDRRDRKPAAKIDDLDALLEDSGPIAPSEAKPKRKRRRKKKSDEAGKPAQKSAKSNDDLGDLDDLLSMD